MQLKNKIKMHQERNTMRVELKNFIEDCKVMDLQDMNMEMKRLKKKYSLRFAIRWSGDQSQSFAALSMDDPRTVAKVEAKQAFVCPAQTGKTSGCDTCGLCWTSDKAVAFITH